MNYSLHLILFLFLIYSKTHAQDSTNGSWNLLLKFDYGFVIAHRPQLEILQEEHVNGFEITVARISNGDKVWQNIYNYPDYGFTLAAFDLGSPTHLGKGIAVYPFVDFPLGKKYGGLHFRYGMGLGYIEKIFEPNENFKNAAIGTHINGVIHFDLHVVKRISHKTIIELGAGITHFSNGSNSFPNLGINIATLNLGFQHSFGKSLPVIHREVQPSDRKTELHVNAGGFYKKIYPPSGRSFFAAAATAMRFKPINNKSAWGVGADIFFDNSLSFRIEEVEEKKAAAIKNFRQGIFGAYHLTVAKMGIMFNMGYYLYNPWKKDGNIYHKISLRYYFEKTFICLNLKSHYARADFVELGVGRRLGW